MRKIRNLFLGLWTVFMTACGLDESQVKRADASQPLFPRGKRTPSEMFTGEAYLYPLAERDQNGNYVIGSVTFEPGGRTNWHTHPAGQILIVTDGQGWYQEKGKKARAIKKGDVINVPENTEHWHGAGTKTSMVHLAVTNYKQDKNAFWLKPVTNDEYEKAQAK